jgi:predicted house-cleaning NTP pyrophosphatase (Maf/HAM1 superfamily)
MKHTIEFNPNIKVKSVNMEEASIFARKGKRVTADTYGQRKASVPMVIIHSKAGVIVRNGRTIQKRNEGKTVKRVLRQLNGVFGQVKTTPVVEVVKPVKKTKWVITKVQKVMRTQESDNHRVVMYKLTNNKGLRKYFISRKAAILFRNEQPK